ncbi:hypothetical protein PVK06_009349 [Gossypium arboreum]|uniref:Variable outer membrane protein n=1 Tax=Gossypium arboreum TaxID=29729 RepID=A0ABR0QME2_GOSAR|nr:hypothetical protein PVK06_009349 [Gossypium arboreum]
MEIKIEKVNEQEDGLVENQGVVKGKKGSSKDFVKVVETRIANVESIMSEVLKR